MSVEQAVEILWKTIINWAVQHRLNTLPTLLAGPARSSFCMLTGHQRVRACSTAAQLRSCMRFCLLVSTRMSTRTVKLRYLRPRLLSYLHGDLTQPPCPLASARDTPTEKSLNSLGYLNCAQAKWDKRQRTCGLPITRAEILAATSMSARQRRSAVRGLRGRTAKPTV